MSGRNWSLPLALLFLALLGWYLFYTEQLVRAFRADTATLTRMFSEVQEGLADTSSTGPLQALYELQQIILDSRVPLILTGPGDTIISAVNLPFEADPATALGQARILDYARRLELRHAPVGDPTVQLIRFGDPPELQRLRWIPWLQAGGLLLTFLIGFLVLRAQRRAAADRAWTAMARELAHQLGTPISSLQGWLEVIRLSPRDRPAGIDDAEIAGEIEQDVHRLERVSRRFELIGREPRLGAIDVGEVVRGVERYLKGRLPRLGAGVRLKVHIRKGLPEVKGSEVLLAWALENIVKNALDALAGRGGTISLRAFHREAGWVTVEVRDTGPGVDPLIRDRLFEPGVSGKAGGWGVGLSLAHRIVVRIHGGRLELLQTGPEGTVFQLRLPVAESP